MNKLVKKMSSKQNKKKKLNAGQMREAIRLFLESVVEISLENNGAEVVDTYESPVGGKYELLMIDYTNTGEKIPYLKMSNPSLKDTYHIEGVGPKVKNCKEAIMFRNGLKKFIEPKVLS